MKFKIKHTKEEQGPVELSLTPDTQGSVCLRANGRPLVWIEADGTLLRNKTTSGELKDMGFQTEAWGVKVR